jgi:hypothetical protein
LPEAIVRILERTVVLDPDARFPTAAGMQRAVEAAMKELGESTTSEDVAAFLRSELPELAQKRREVVNRAVDESRDRGVPSSTVKSVEPDVAFAPTVMSERQPKTAREGQGGQGGTASSASQPPRMDRPSDAGTIALVSKKEPPRREPPPATDVAHALDQEPIKIPKTSKAWLWITLIVLVGAGGAAYQYPEQARGIAAKVGIGGASEPGLQVVPVPTDTVPGAASAPAAASASATASAPAPASASAPAPAPTSASASASASALASASAAASAAASAHLHHTWPGGQRPPGAPSEGATEPVNPNWSLYNKDPKAPAPAASGDNPYQGGNPL